MPYEVEYSTLLNLFIKLVDSQAGQKIEPGNEWLNDAQTLSIKLFRHLASMRVLADGSTIESDGCPTISFIDHASVKVVARAALETYLVFFYLYCDSDRSLSEFRHKTWRISGLADRQKTHTSTEQANEFLNDEKKQLQKLREEIEASPHISAYTSRQQRRLASGDWRIGISWAALGLRAGFHEKYFENIYGYLCGYSHSSYISALQVGQAQSIDDQKMLTQSILGIGVVLMANYAFSYSKTFNTADIVLNADPVAKGIAEKWHFGPEDMAAIYDC